MAREEERLPSFGDWQIAHAGQVKGPDGPWTVWFTGVGCMAHTTEDVARLMLKSMGVEWNDLRFVDCHVDRPSRR